MLIQRAINHNIVTMENIMDRHKKHIPASFGKDYRIQFEIHPKLKKRSF